MAKAILYLDGAYVPVPDQALAAFLPGKALGQGVFETMRVVQGKVEFLGEHVERMLAGLQALKIRHAFTARRLQGICRGVARRNRSNALGRMRLMVFQQARLHCAAMVLPYHPPTDAQYGQGLKAVILRTRRPAGAAAARVKSLDYGVFSAALRQAAAQGADEAILVNARGHVFEAARANVFIVYKGELMTPPLSSGCLDGTMRREVMRLAAAMGTPVQERNISPAMVRAAENILLTNSLMGIIPCRV